MAAPRSALWALASVGAILFLGRRATASTQAPRVDSTWSLGRLTEYHPDAPASAGTAVLRREGGPRDRRRQPLITLEQHRSDRARYPYASVASDLMVEGRAVPYGARIHIEALPADVLRLVDTGGNFLGDNKQIREPGHEPLDIATAWPGKSQKLSGKKTRFKIDWTDTLPEPRPRVS